MLIANLLALIESSAGDLRKKGILNVMITDSTGITVSFSMAPVELEADDGEQEDEPELDVLDDPRTYGRTKTVPGKQPDQRKARR